MSHLLGCVCECRLSPGTSQRWVLTQDSGPNPHGTHLRPAPLPSFICPIPRQGWRLCLPLGHSRRQCVPRAGDLPLHQTATVQSQQLWPPRAGGQENPGEPHGQGSRQGPQGGPNAGVRRVVRPGVPCSLGDGEVPRECWEQICILKPAGWAAVGIWAPLQLGQ